MATNLFTYRDLLVHMMEYVGGAAEATSQSRLRQAIQSGYRSLAYEHDWSYLYRYYQLLFNAPYTTGTISYDHTGGTYERTVTVASGTWPSWAATGHIRIANAWYEVDQRISDDDITLSADYNPGQDVASGTSYRLYQSSYTLPADFLSMHNPEQYATPALIAYIPPQDWHTLERYASSSGNQAYWTVIEDRKNQGRYQVALWPYPATAVTLAFVYYRMPRDLVFTGYGANETTGTASNSGSVVTGSGTAFQASHVGSMFRFGTSSNAPEGLTGQYPYQEQRIIKSVASTTSLTLDSAPSATYSGVKFNISDPVDMPMNMYDCLLRGCEYQSTIVRKDSQGQSMRYSAYRQALDLAMQSDDRVQSMSVAGRPVGWIKSQLGIPVNWNVNT